jgi:hypothetical protein
MHMTALSVATWQIKPPRGYMHPRSASVRRKCLVLWIVKKQTRYNVCRVGCLQDLLFGGASTHEGYHSEFCFIPYGDGWGNRIMFSMVHACIPVITQVGIT